MSRAEVEPMAPAESEPPPPSGTPSGWETVVRAGGVVVSIVAALVSGLFELILTPARAGDVVGVWRGDPIGSGHGPVIGLSVLLAVVLNYAIAWFAVSTTGRRWALGPPWALWTLMMLLAAGVRTSEGDYLLAGNDWVGLVMILLGSLSFAVYSYRMILRRVIRS
jgi:predicted Na+-dependent transporter